MTPMRLRFVLLLCLPFLLASCLLPWDEYTSLPPATPVELAVDLKELFRGRMTCGIYKDTIWWYDPKPTFHEPYSWDMPFPRPKSVFEAYVNLECPDLRMPVIVALYGNNRTATEAFFRQRSDLLQANNSAYYEGEAKNLDVRWLRSLHTDRSFMKCETYFIDSRACGVGLLYGPVFIKFDTYIEKAMTPEVFQVFLSTVDEKMRPVWAELYTQRTIDSSEN